MTELIQLLFVEFKRVAAEYKGLRQERLLIESELNLTSERIRLLRELLRLEGFKEALGE